LVASPLLFRPAADPSPSIFDLSTIGMVRDGEQICDDTNPRLQDIRSATMDQIEVVAPVKQV